MRNSQRSFSLFAILSSFAVAAVGEAADATTKPPGWFSKLDRDGNGSLAGKEAERFLTAMDSDEDGMVTVAEAIAYMKTRARNTTRTGGRRDRTFRARELDSREKTGNGLWVVSIGHSCVVPAIEPFVKIAVADGYENHTQVRQIAGGAAGAAEAQWNRSDDQQDAKQALSTGKIDVMTFGHLVAANGKSYGCDVEDYKRWIEFGLKHNPDMKFHIQDLWPWLPGAQRSVKFEDFNLADYEAAMTHVSKSLASIVEELNREYPDRVRVIPVGPAMVELVRKVTKSELPGVDAVLVPPKEASERVGLYRDMIHPTNVIATLEGYIYYACLYGKNPAELKTGICRDESLDRILRDVAWNVVTQHPLSGVRE